MAVFFLFFSLFLLFILIISDEIDSVFMTEISRCYKDARKRMKLEAKSKTEEKNETIKKKKGKEESKIEEIPEEDRLSTGKRMGGTRRWRKGKGGLEVCRKQI